MGNIRKMKQIERKNNGYYQREKDAKEWYKRTYGKINNKLSTNSNIVRCD